MRAVAGDHGAEAGVLLLISFGDWLPRLSEAGLVTLDMCLEGCCGDGPTAHINWAGVDAALSGGLLIGSSSDVGVVRIAASLADGRPVDLHDLAAGLDR